MAARSACSGSSASIDRTGVGGAGSEPDIECRIGFAGRKHAKALGQAQCLAVETGTRHSLLRVPSRRRKPRRWPGCFLGRRAQIHRRTAAQAAEQHRQPSADLREVDPGSMLTRGASRRLASACQSFPTDFLGFPWRDVDPGHRRPHPNTAVTRSRSPRFTSASSVSGSIMAARMARSTGMPRWMSVAA